MQSRLRVGGLGLAFLVLSACGDMGSSGGVGAAGFQKKYAFARDALERGQYDKAAQRFAAIIPRAGPLAPRLRLEYAHALLRAGHFDQASAAAAGLVRELDGTGRSAALMVQGTAEHELGLTALAAGDRATGRRHLLAAQTALSAMIAADPQLDPMGAMAGRNASIAARLKSI